MAWYRAGTVTVTNGSTAVVGSSTGWVGGGVALGDVFTVDNVTLYEIIGIADDTHLTLDRAYAGTTATGSYAIIRNLSPPGAAMMTSLTALTGAVNTLIGETTAPGLGLANAFAVTAHAIPNMTVAIASAMMLVAGSPTVIAAQSSATITAPVSHPRLDLVVADIFTGTVSVITGTENATPAVPSLHVGQIPLASLALSVGATSIGAAQITDLRPVFDAGLISGSLNAKSYGAVGDGSTVNGTALQNAINACVLAAGGYAFVLDIPGGSYVVDSTLTIPSNIRLRGVGAAVYGRSGTHLVRNGNFTLITSTNTGTITPTFDLNESVFIEDICLDGGGSGNGWTTDLVNLSACYEFKFSRVWFTGCAGRALKTVELWDSRFLDCRFTFCGSQDGTLPAVSLLSPGGVSYDNTSNNLYFWGGRFESCPGVCVEVTGGNGIDVWFTDTKFECVNTQLDYLVRVSSGTGVHFQPVWMYASPSSWASKSWTDTTTSLTPGSTVTLSIATGDTSIYAAASTTATPCGLSVVVYQTANPANYMTGRVTSYNSSTGAITIVTDQVVGGTAATGWTIKPCHPGLLYAHGSQLISGRIIGGFNAGVLGSTTTFAKCLVHLDASAACDLDLDVAQGTHTLIGNSLAAFHDTTTSGHVQSTAGGGTMNFTVETGRTLATGSILYISGGTVPYMTDWMVARVVSYNSSTGALQVAVDPDGWGGVQTDTITNWLLIPAPAANAVLLTNTLDPWQGDKISIRGKAEPYANIVQTRYSPKPQQLEGVNLMAWNATLLKAQNLSLQDQLILQHSASFATIAGTEYMTGQFQLYVYDFARSAAFDILLIDSNRNISFQQPVLFNSNAQTSPLRWYDGSNGGSFNPATGVFTGGSYGQTQIKGSIAGAAYLPQDGSGYIKGVVGDIWLNSNPVVPSGYAYAPILTAWHAVTNYYISGGTTYPAIYMSPPPLELSGTRASVPTSASGYAQGTKYRYTDPIAGDYEGQIVVSTGTSLVWKTFGPIAA